MEEALLERLRRITPEEERLLNGAPDIERTIYTSEADFHIESRKMLSRGQLIGVRPHTRFARFPQHTHNYVEIIYMCQGSTTHILDGKSRVTLEKGDLLFLNQHISHEILPAGEADLGVNFIILPEFFDASFPMVDGNHRLREFLEELLRRDGGGRYLHFQVSGVLPIQNLVENMVYALIYQQGDAHRINQTTMGLLLMELSHFTDCLAPPQPGPGTLAAEVADYIEAHYRDGSLRELAASLGRSPAGLSRMISGAAGASFKELQQKKRFAVALELLRVSRLSVSDIIAAVGYENSSYFYRTFQKKYRQSPREYRMQNRGGPG